MEIKPLIQENVQAYLDYLRLAIKLEPDMMTTGRIDEKAITDALSSDPSEVCKSLLAFEDNQVIGRLEYHFYTCIQDGYKMAYVNWVYVLPEHRHKGVAQKLFQAFEQVCIENKVNQYFLIRANNKNAARFYDSFTNAKTTNTDILRKTLI